MLGRFSDYVIANGGTTVLTEVPEMFGAEQLLMSHCRDEATFDKLVTMVNDFKQYFIAHDQPIYENPSPGNKAGGITTLEDKSLGCTQKAGSSRGGCSALRRAPEGSWSEFTERAGQRRGRHQRAGRRRLPYGAVQHRSRHAVRRLCANGEDRHQQRAGGEEKHWIDFDAGQLLHGKTMPQLLEEFVDAIVAFANGKPTCNEQNDFRELAIFKSGVTL